MKAQAYGIDISNYGGEVTPEKLAGLQQAGVRFCIIGYQDADLFEQQARALASVDIKVAAYFFIYWSRATKAEQQRLTSMLDHLHTIEQTGALFGWPRPDATDMPKVWLDFEEDTTTKPATNPSVAEVIQVGRSFMDMVTGRGFSAGVYTRRDWWETWAGNWTGLSDRPLWHASQYETVTPVPFSDFFQKPYGGWPVPMCWQFRGTDVVGGMSCDQDLEEWEAEPLPAQQPATVTMTVTEPDGRVRTFVGQEQL